MNCGLLLSEISPSLSESILLIFLLYVYNACVCVCMCMHACVQIHVEVKDSPRFCFLGTSVILGLLFEAESMSLTVLELTDSVD